MTHNKLTCLFGFHDYSDEVTKDKEGRSIHLCKHCKKSARWEWQWLQENNACYDYDKKGNLVHIKWDDGCECWRDKNGRWVGRYVTLR